MVIAHGVGCGDGSGSQPREQLRQCHDECYRNARRCISKADADYQKTLDTLIAPDPQPAGNVNACILPLEEYHNNPVNIMLIYHNKCSYQVDFVHCYEKMPEEKKTCDIMAIESGSARRMGFVEHYYMDGFIRRGEPGAIVMGWGAFASPGEAQAFAAQIER